MQVTETKSEGLKREFQVVVPAAELETRLATELDGIKGKVQIKASARARCRWPTCARSTVAP